MFCFFQSFIITLVSFFKNCFIPAHYDPNRFFNVKYLTKPVVCQSDIQIEVTIQVVYAISLKFFFSMYFF